jgi:hypothetical protein
MKSALECQCPSLKISDQCYARASRTPSVTGSCLRCGRPLHSVNVATGDIDQAFEACSGSTLNVALGTLSDRFPAMHSHGYVSVQKGPKLYTHIRRYWSSWFTTLHIPDVVQAVATFAECVVAAFGNVVFKIPRLPIGAIESAGAVNVLLDYCEFTLLTSALLLQHHRFGFLIGDQRRRHLMWARYVDDTLRSL